MTRQVREQKRFLTGTIQEPGRRPQVVRLNVEDIKEQDEVVTVTDTTYTIEGKKFILVDDDTAGAAVTITLPPAIDSTDRVIVVKKIGSTAAVTVDGNSSELIDGATTTSIVSQYTALQLVSDGANWFKI
jgi:hypothetical protein